MTGSLGDVYEKLGRNGAGKWAPDIAACIAGCFSVLSTTPLLLAFATIRHGKRAQTQTLSPDIFWWGRGLQREWVGAKKFGMLLETREIKLFGLDIPGFCWDILAVPEKLEKKMFVFNVWP